MTPAVILLIAVSLSVLVLSFCAWRLTSSRSVIFNGFFGSAAILFAAWFLEGRQQLQLACVIPFVVAMAFLGRGGALWWRSRKGEATLRVPSMLLLAAAVLSFVGAVAAYRAA